MRRVVTGHRNGKSVILEDKEISPQGRFGSGGAAIWKTEGIPTIPLEEEKYTQQLPMEFAKPGVTDIRVFVTPPDKEYLQKAKENGVDLVGEWRKTFGDDFRMHTTDTIDYGIVVSGEMWMEVDDGVEVHLKAGDCVIQNGTRHGWHNKSSKNCTMVFIMTGAKREK